MRAKGMISRPKLEAWKARMGDERADLQALAAASPAMFPYAWPARVTVLDDSATVERTVSGHHGFAPTVVPFGDYNTERDAAEYSAGLWENFYGDWRFGPHPDYSALSVLDFFLPFGSGNAGFDRREWHAGSMDRESTLARIAAIPDLLDQMDAITAVMGGLARFQYWEQDYYPFRNREWEADDHVLVTSLEYKVLTVGEAKGDAPDYWEALFHYTSPGDGADCWDSVGAEMEARGAIALQMMADLITSAGIPDAPDVRIWSNGSQTEGRGI